ncbi:hypothetical protein [Tateyamaria sp. SN6-1]|uniref:hypothetical protein n=1 Tax=Tateyamaria sp. SN6-1 TaxID=3092148 RepID=UPI0039F4F9E9
MLVAPDISITTRLLELETIKTWSLIATVLGDLEDDTVSGRALWSLLEPLGIKAEAMRVALHRLKKDGWVVSNKVGREVIYALSQRGLAETVAARTDVYRHDVKYPEGWHMALLGPDPVPFDSAHVMLDRNLILVPVAGTVPDNAALTPAPQDMPDWFQNCLVPQHMRERAQDLSDLARDFLQRPSPDTTSVRLILLHHWRKMALRTGTWAHIGLQPDGVMARCHRDMRAFFDQTPPASPKS